MTTIYTWDTDQLLKSSYKNFIEIPNLLKKNQNGLIVMNYSLMSNIFSVSSFCFPIFFSHENVIQRSKNRPYIGS